MSPDPRFAGIGGLLAALRSRRNGTGRSTSFIHYPFTDVTIYEARVSVPVSARCLLKCYMAPRALLARVGH